MQSVEILKDPFPKAADFGPDTTKSQACKATGQKKRLEHGGTRDDWFEIGCLLVSLGTISIFPHCSRQ